MNNSIMSKWYLKAILILAGIITIFLIVKSFRDGYEEGRQMKELEIKSQKMK